MKTISIEISGVADKSNIILRFSSGREEGSGFHCYPRSLSSLGAFSSSLDPSTNLTQSDETVVQICSDIGNDANGELQPFEIFSVFSVDALGESYVLNESLNSTGDILSTVGGNVGIQNKLVHIGTEAILLGSKIDSTDEMASFEIIERGAVGTIAQAHNIDESIGFAPDIALQPFVWLGRQVKVFLDGELWRVGLISSAPSFVDGMISLSFVGIENRFSDLPPSATTPFKNNLHNLHVLRPQKMGGYLLRMNGNSPVYSGKHQRPSTLTFSNTKFTGFSSEAEQIASIIMNANNAPIGGMLAGSCINKPRVVIDGQVVQSLYFSYVSGSECTLYHAACGFSGPAATTSGALFDCYFYFLPEARLYTRRVGSDTTLQGGQALANSIRERSTRTVNYPVTYTTGEPFFNLSSNQVDDGWIAKSPLAGGWKFQIGIVQRYQNAQRPLKTTQKTLYSALLDEQPDLNLTINQSYSINAGPDVFLPKETAESALISYPIRLNCEPDSVTRIEGRTNTAEICWLNLNSEKDSLTKVPLLYADRWWEIGDILTLTKKFPGKNIQYVRATWTEPDGQERTCKALVSFLEKYGSQYRYSCDTLAAGFGDWPGFGRCSISPIIATKSDSDSGFLIPFAVSVDGLSSNGESDVLASGLSIDSSLIDESSFSSFSNMAAVSGWEVDVSEDVDVEAIISTMLLSTVSTITPGFDKDKERFDLKRTWLGYPTRAQVENAEIITDDEIIGIPSSTIESNVFTSYEMKLPGESSIVWRDVDAEQRYGIGSSMKLDFTSARFNQTQGSRLVQALRGSLGAFCEYYGTSKRKWFIQIPFEKAKNYRVGQVVNISSKYLSGYSVGVGVDGSPGTITRLELNPAEGTATLEIWARKRTCGGYSQSLIVNAATITSRTTAAITADKNTLSDDDLSFFGVGDQVYLTVHGLTTEPWTITTINDSTGEIVLTSSTSKNRYVYQYTSAYPVGIVEIRKSSQVPFFILGTDRFA